MIIYTSGPVGVPVIVVIEEVIVVVGVVVLTVVVVIICQYNYVLCSHSCSSKNKEGEEVIVLIQTKVVKKQHEVS